MAKVIATPNHYYKFKVVDKDDESICYGFGDTHLDAWENAFNCLFYKHYGFIENIKHLLKEEDE